MNASIRKLPLLFFVLLSATSMADVPGGGVRWYTAFQISNVESFKDYTFFYVKDKKESQKIEGDKTYSFDHPGAPSKWDIAVFAKNNATGQATDSISVGTEGKKTVITVKEIKDNKIVFEEKPSDYDGKKSGASSSADSTEGRSSPVNKVLIGISGAGLLIFGLIMSKRGNKA